RLAEPLRPDTLADVPTKRIVRPVRQGRQAEHIPRLAVAGGDPAGAEIIVLRQDAAGQVIEVPAGLDQDNATARLHAGAHVRAEPLPVPLAIDLALRFLMTLHRIVNDEEIGALAGNRSADAG